MTERADEREPDGAPASARERVLLELARRDKTNRDSTFRAITEATAVMLDVARASIWELVDDACSPPAEADTRLVCRDLYLLESRRHVSSLPIHRCDFERYLDAVQARRTITADDARNDPRTSEFTSFYLEPLGITSMLDVPIWHRGQLYGVLCCEHVGPLRHWRADEQGFAVHMADITAACLEAVAQVSQSRLWMAVLEALSEGVVVMDPTGTTVAANRAAESELDSRTGQTLEDRLRMLQFVDAADRPVPASDWPFPRVQRGEVIRGEIYGVINKRTGTRRYVRSTASRVVENGQLEYVVYVFSDVSEEVRMERLKQELLSHVAHQIKTPLAIAKGSAQHLASVEVPQETSRKMLDAIVSSCDRIDHLCETLLDLASIIFGRLRLTHERLDLADVVLTTLQRAERMAPSHRFQLERKSMAPVAVDRARIEQAVRQLLDNAIAFSPPGSSIEVTVATEDGKVRLAVRDHGIGIPAGREHDVFTLFAGARADGGAKERGGLGVGLYLAREIVRRHGGEMWFESVEGEGTTFYVQVPVAEP